MKRDATRSTLNELIKQIQRWSKQLDDDDARDNQTVGERTQEKEKQKGILNEKMKVLQSMIDLSANDTVARAGELKQLHADAKEITKQSDTLMKVWLSTAVEDSPIPPSIAVKMWEQLHSTELWENLGRSRFNEQGRLNSWLCSVKQTTVRTQLVYTLSHF